MPHEDKEALLHGEKNSKIDPHMVKKAPHQEKNVVKRTSRKEKVAKRPSNDEKGPS